MQLWRKLVRDQCPTAMRGPIAEGDHSHSIEGLRAAVLRNILVFFQSSSPGGENHHV